MSDAKDWLLVKRDLYWRPGDLGYTGIRDKAARYTYEEAKARIGVGVTMVKVDDAPEFSGSCYEDLARAHLTKQRDTLRAALVKAERILARNLGHQTEKCYDALALIRQAIHPEP